MLTCRGCLRLGLQSFAEDFPATIVSGTSRQLSQNSTAKTWRRNASTMQLKGDGIASHKRNGPRFMTAADIRQKQIRKELEVLNDPLKLADHTLDFIRRDRREEALEVLRMACKDKLCTVSWNHLIDDDMAHGRCSDALKLYNEMKKRAQYPDAYTYTIILRGFANFAHRHDSVGQALKIYHSMFADNSPCKPSTIHTNAVLKVCARANDLDAVFGIAARLPKAGPGAPDHYTYTTIINCLRHTAWSNGRNMKDESDEQMLERRQRAVFQGRRIWMDIIERWKKGRIAIDEELTCTMGRLLLLGSMEKDTDDVLSLVEQTMLLPREMPPVGSSDRKTHLKTEKHKFKNPYALEEEFSPPEQEKSVTALVSSDSTEMVEPADERPEFNEFAPVIADDVTRIYARPGRSTLSLVIEACTRMNAAKPAIIYWGKLTETIEPDLENFHVYLRLLRLSRSSTLVVEMLDDMLTRSDQGGLGLKPEPKTFRIALASCVRDGNNVKALANATKIVHTMMRAIEDLDLGAADVFVKILTKKGIQRPLDDMIAALEALGIMWRSACAAHNWGTRGTKPDLDMLPIPKQDSKDENTEQERRSTLHTRPKKPVNEVSKHYRHPLELQHLGKAYLAELSRFLDVYAPQMSSPQTKQAKFEVGRVSAQLGRISHGSKKWASRPQQE